MVVRLTEGLLDEGLMLGRLLSSSPGESAGNSEFVSELNGTDSGARPDAQYQQTREREIVVTCVTKGTNLPPSSDTKSEII